MIIKVSGIQPIEASSCAAYASSSVAQVAEVTIPTDVGGNLDGKYFTLWGANNAVGYYVWFNETTATAPDPQTLVPELANMTGIEVAYTAADTGTVIAAVADGLIQAKAEFVTAVATAAKIVITNAAAGGCWAPADGVSGYESGISPITVTAEGFTAFDDTNLKMYKIIGKIADHKQYWFGGEYREDANKKTDITIIVPERRIEYFAEYV